MKLRRFEALGLLPNKGPFTVYILSVTVSGDVWTDRRRVDVEYLLDKLVGDLPWFELFDLRIKWQSEKTEFFWKKDKELGSVIKIGPNAYIKPAPAKVKKLLSSNKKKALPKAFIDAESLAAEARQRLQGVL